MKPVICTSMKRSFCDILFKRLNSCITNGEQNCIFFCDHNLKELKYFHIMF